MNLSFNKSELKIALCLIPFFTFAVGFKWPILGIAVNAGRYIVLLLMVIKIFCSKNYKKLFREKIFIILLVFYIILCASTVINGGNVINAFQLAMYGIVPFLIFYNYCAENGNILNGINIAFTLLIIINGIIMIIYPEGIHQTFSSNTITRYYLFGAKNQMVAPILVGMCFFVEKSYYEYGKIRLGAIIKSLVCIFELIVGDSGTGIAAIIIFAIIILYQEIKKRDINPTFSIGMVAVVFVLIVILRMQNLFAFFIEGVLDKSLDLTNRIYIWDTALTSIKANPLIGTGVSDSMAGSVDLKLDYTEEITFSHDMYLDVLVMGGIIAFVFFVLILICTLQNYKKAKISQIKGVIWCGLIVYLIASIFDIYTGNYCMYIIVAYIAIKKYLVPNSLTLVKREITCRE